MLVANTFFFSNNAVKSFYSRVVKTGDCSPFPKRQILDSSKLKQYADDTFEFDENGRKFSKQVEYTVGKRRNCSLRAISPFSTVFSKDLYCRHVKIRTCLGKS